MIQIETNPSDRQLRQFAGIWFPLFAVMVGYILISAFDLHQVAYGLWAFAGIAAVVGLIAPKAIKFLFVGLMFLTFPIGFVVSHVILVVLYYLILSPLGILLRLIGKDPMVKKPDPNASSYWKVREPVTDTETYFRQF